MIDLSYASSRLEDVRISWLDTKSLVELGERPEGLTDKEYRIVMNHKDAIQFITENRADLAAWSAADQSPQAAGAWQA